MSHASRVTICDERREMQRLMQERQRRHPERAEPDWIQNFWAERRSMLT